MKADSCGTASEQSRARMGWKSATQARIAGVDRARNCSACRFSFCKMTGRGDGGMNCGFYCGHYKAGGYTGHSTRESATCDFWTGKP